MMKKVLIIIILFQPLFLNAQKEIVSQGLFWARYDLNLKVNNNLHLQQEIEERSYWFPLRQHQLLIRSHAHTNLGNNFTLHTGFTYFIQSLPHDPYSDLNINRVELRPQFGLSFKNKISERVSLKHRYWNEFRIFEKNDSFEYGNIRLRYLLSLSFKLTDDLKAKVFDEIFLNFGNKIVINTFDQNRYGFSFSYRVSEYLDLEASYFNWFQERSSGVEYFNRDIYRFTIHNNFSI